MINTFEINSLTGTSPFDVYVCDVNQIYCVSAATISNTIPPEPSTIINIPTLFLGAPQILVKVIDSNNCITFFVIDCSTTPTPTPTISPTPTPTPTPTVSPFLPDCTDIQFCGNGVFSPPAIFSYTNCFGNSVVTGVTSPCITDCVDFNIPITLVSGVGSYTILGNIICPTPLPTVPLCVTLYSSAITSFYTCFLYQQGTYNSKPYYEILESGCISSTGLYIFWDNATSRWKISNSVGGVTTYLYNLNPGPYPESIPPYSWIYNTGSTNEFYSTINTCITPTPTPTPSPTPLPVSGLTWVTTTNTSGVTGCEDAGWVISPDNLTITFNVAPSQNCVPTGCSITQNATATATITVGPVNTNLNINWTGQGEQEATTFDEMKFYLDAVEVQNGHAPGGGLGCVDGPIVPTILVAPPYPLLAGTTYTLLLSFSTNDPLYHVNSFYTATLSFT